MSGDDTTRRGSTDEERIVFRSLNVQVAGAICRGLLGGRVGATVAS